MMDEKQPQRSHKHLKAKSRSTKKPLGSDGSSSVDQIDKLPNEEQSPHDMFGVYPSDHKDDFDREELAKILSQCWLSDYLQGARDFCDQQQSDYPSYKIMWRRLTAILEVAADLAAELKEDVTSRREKPEPAAKVELSDFLERYPWATHRDWREYYIYLNDRTLPRPTKARAFIFRSMEWWSQAREGQQ